MRISDWSSDVYSSDLRPGRHRPDDPGHADHGRLRLSGDDLDGVHHAGPRPGTGPDAAAGGTGAVAAGSADLGPADAGGGGIPGGRRAHLGGYATLADARSEERRVGKEWVSTCRSRGSP